MEFSVIDLFKLIALLIAVLVTSSLFMLFFKRSRKAGRRILGLIFAIFVIAAVIFYYPRHFDRTYISESDISGAVSLRKYADSLHFFLGAAGNNETVYDPLFYTNFNSITPETALKWGSLLKNNEPGNYDFSRADSIVDRALRDGIRVRGHVLVWGKLSGMFKSPDLEAYLDKFPESTRDTLLWDLMEKHITTVLNHFRGKILTWEVVNEPLATWGSGEFEKNVYFNHLGEDYISRSFKLAHSLDPDLKLFLNENFMNYHDRRSESFITLVSKLKKEGVPIYGVGIQSHVISPDTTFGDFARFIKRIGDLGLAVEITELDARLALFRRADDPYKAQGEYYGKMLRICLVNPQVRGLTFWGYCDAHSWYDDMPYLFPKPNEPYLFDGEKHPKPGFHELYKVLKRTCENNMI